MARATGNSANHRPERFYAGIALALAAVAIVGFAPTYLLRPLFGHGPLSTLLRIHAALYTGWTLVFVTQAFLIRAERVELHRRLGAAAAVLALVMLPVGVETALAAARRGVAPNGLDPLVFLAIPLGAVALFAGFVTTGLLNRQRPDVHRRCMLLATISIISPAIARLWFVGQRPVVALALTCVFVIAAMVHDHRTNGRIHPVYLWGGGLVLLSGPIRIGIGHTAAWLGFARLLTG